MKPATNRIWDEAIRTLEGKAKDTLTEFERHIHDRLVELESLIATGNQGLDNLREQLTLVEQQVTKACGAYENMSDMIATYYVKRSKEAQHETTDKADRDDSNESDSDTDSADSEASS
jgi:hypothetical protein